MQRLKYKHILVGITGSIAAYKAAEVVRQLKNQGAEVRVIMTAGALEFVTSMTFQALSGQPVHTELLNESAEAAMGHIQLARWADAVVIVPASANFISRLVQGRADDLLCAVCLACKAPIAVVPAMNQQMWMNSATQHNIETLGLRGIAVFGPATGQQACGDVGPGRMIEATDVIHLMTGLFKGRLLEGKTVLITAGPTREAIDPVRYLTNRSSGKMGFALARAAVEQGARCILVSGPVSLPSPDRVERLNVESAVEMLDAVMSQLPLSDIFIACAAVADYRPANITATKIKKDEQTYHLELIPNPDIVATVAQTDSVFTVGFAAETNDLEQYAKSKLVNKHLDMIAANQVGQANSGFESDENALTVFWPTGQTELPLARKSVLANQLIKLIAERYSER